MAHDESDRSFHDYVHAETGTVDRLIFSDPDIYDLEMERIFARAWNFMCHESQIPKVGDYFLSYIGEESVICTRDKTGTPRVFLNSCRHRGNAVCRAEIGNTRTFTCTYHGWSYGLDGKLFGIPGNSECYHGELNREQWGLIAAGKVASYRGFVFATMDPDAPELEDYLGEVGRMGLDMCASRGTVVAVDGIQKNQIACNWKLGVDNTFDYYHGPISHASAYMSGFRKGLKIDPADTVPKEHRVILGEYGHAIGGPRLTQEKFDALDPEAGMRLSSRDDSWRKRIPTAAAELGPVGMTSTGHPNIFPNLWISTHGTQFSLRLPKGPGKTEFWWFTFIEEALPEEAKSDQIHTANRTFGPAGMLEQDDGENWDQSTRQTRGVVARRYPLNYAMGLGHGEPKLLPEGGPLHIDGPMNEHAQLWTYRAWADWMDAASWASLRQHRSPVPTEAV